MPIDGVVIRNLVKELRLKLLNGKVDKISQPETDEIILTIRNNGENFKLLLSSSPSCPKVHLTDQQKLNPVSAPLFCMVLRKHLSGGKITGISQFNMDRIIKFFIEGYDELGNKSTKVLVCEIMGRHSNIILMNEDSGEIYDSIKHVNMEMSSFRQVLPGCKYKNPPLQDKLEPLDFNMNEFMKRLDNVSVPQKLGKFISQNIDGISMLASREICCSAGIDEGMDILDLSKVLKESLSLSIDNFIKNILEENFLPCIYYNSDGSLFDFYSLKLNYLNGLNIEYDDSISAAIERFYFKTDNESRIRQKSQDIHRVISVNLDRCYKKLSIQETKLLECHEKDKWKLYGDLIMSNLYSIKKGDNNAHVVNYFDENEVMIDIPLDFTLSPIDNAQKYYKKYNKEKTAEIITLSQIKENREEISYLENQVFNLSSCTLDSEINEIRSELISLSYIKYKKKPASRKLKQTKPMHFISSDGFDIYVGKNNVQNDFITTKLAEAYDVWMHTKNIPGSHVVIKTGKKPVTETVLNEASLLASYFSKARDSSSVPVDFTERKNVKKPSGAKPGMVIYYTNKTIYVTPDEGKVNQLKKV